MRTFVEDRSEFTPFWDQPMWNPLQFFRSTGLSADEFHRQREEILRTRPVPKIWLLGKTGSGKSSIIRELTGASQAVVGDGFRPQTRCTQLYSFPDAETPLIHFYDTRGFGETGYDPSEDINTLDPQAHLLIVTIRATDQSAAAIVEPLRRLRQRFPQRPVLLAITALHDAYVGQDHPSPDPFAVPSNEIPGLHADEIPPPIESLPANLPGDLGKCLEAHFERFAGLFDCYVPLDFTLPDDGFQPADFGADRLKQQIQQILPAAYREPFLYVEQFRTSLDTLYDQRAHPIILGRAMLAASAAAVPIPWADIPLVMGVQSELAYKLASLYNQKLDQTLVLQMSGILGGRVAVRFALREVAKLIPFVGTVIGAAANAAAAFGWVYASGKAWNWYFKTVRNGSTPTTEQIAAIYQEELAHAGRLWQKRPGTTASLEAANPP